MSTIVLVCFLFLLLGMALPIYPYSRGWGYYPSGVIATIVAAVILLSFI